MDGGCINPTTRVAGVKAQPPPMTSLSASSSRAAPFHPPTGLGNRHRSLALGHGVVLVEVHLEVYS